MNHSTSHFIGIDIESSGFEEIFTKIIEILGDDISCIELQNIKSLHITLYYLKRYISPEESIYIRGFIAQHSISGILRITEHRIFYNASIPYTYYLVPELNINMEQMNREIAYNLPSMSVIRENKFEFVPHITLFRVKDILRFEKYRDSIEGILRNFTQKNEEYIFSRIALYYVDAGINPEKQTIIL